MKECNCKPGGFESEIVAIPDGMILHREIRNISVDACIAPVIRLLLDNGIETLGCCCGHKTEQMTSPRAFPAHPSLVIANSYSVEDCQRIADLIATVDDRQWDIQQWKLVIFASRQTKIEKLAAETHSLQRLLQVYGRHSDDCLEPIGVECSCGWSVVETALAERGR